MSINGAEEELSAVGCWLRVDAQYADHFREGSNPYLSALEVECSCQSAEAVSDKN